MEFVDDQGVRWVDTGEPSRRGGESTVWFAVGPAGERAVVKVGDAPEDGWIRAEHDLIASLHGSGLDDLVVRTLGRGVMGRRPFAVYARCAASLDEPGALPADPAARRRIAAEVCEAVARLHARRPPVVHGDLKPANVLLGPAGEVLLGDFGAARGWRPGTTTTLTLFTPGWAAPEVVVGRRPSPTSDLFSLAATVHAVLVGVPPRAARANEASARLGRGDGLGLWAEDREALWRATRDPVLASVLAQALDPDPGRRRGSARELAELLRAPPAALRAPWDRLGAAALGMVFLAPVLPAPPAVAWLSAGAHATLDGGVTLSRDLAVDPWLVTQAEWRRVLHEDPTRLREFDGTSVGERCDAWRRRGTRVTDPVPITGDDLPVACVDLPDAARYANARSELDGLVPVYRTEAGRLVRDLEADGWRLPTEAEWAVTADAVRRVDPDRRCAVANVADRLAEEAVNGLLHGAACDDGHRAASPVGALPPTPDGIWDAMGNVRVWTWDDDRPRGRATVRGQSWSMPAELGEELDEHVRAVTIGLRVVRNGPAPR